MRIAVLGATGYVGTHVVAEAVARGHDVTAVVRDSTRAPGLSATAHVRTGDVADAAEVAQLAAGQDVVVAATRPPVGLEDELVAMTAAQLAGVVGTGARLLVVGGAGSLTVPGTGGRLVADDPDLVTPEYRAIARAGISQLAACRTAAGAPGADWSYLSPPAHLVPGPRTGHYRIGADELVVDDAGRSRISVSDLAVALLDEAQAPAHLGARFTVAY